MMFSPDVPDDNVPDDDVCFVTISIDSSLSHYYLSLSLSVM